MSIPAKVRKHLSNTLWYHATSLDGWKSICQKGVLAAYNKDTSDALDFGYGFNMTPTKERAESFIAGLFKNKVYEHNEAVVMGFLFEPLNAFENDTYKTKILNSYDDEFAMFVFDNRDHNIDGCNQHSYDIIFGVMSDSVPTITMSEYKMGRISKLEAVETLKKPTSMKQLSLHNQDLCDILKLQEVYLVDLNTFERKGLNPNEYRK